jgi:hypothetical protein
MTLSISERPKWRGLTVAAVSLALCALPSASLADRRYFLNTYTPYVDQAGESEVEVWLTAKHGKQDPAERASLAPRAEWEYAINSRLTGAAYLNFLRPSDGSLHLDSSSLEFIYRLAEPGGHIVDPAAYLEITESGDELEIETKLLLARHLDRWLAATNLIGEFEFRHDDVERLADGTVLRNGVAAEITGGLSYGVGRRLALGFEARGRSEHPNFDRQAAALFSAGPSLNFQLGEFQAALGVLRQIRGTPRTAGGRNLLDFEKTQVRLVIGFEL